MLLRKSVIAGALGAAGLVVLMCVLAESRREGRWQRLAMGMSEEAVRRTVGEPDRIGSAEWVGVGERRALRWEYDRGGHTYRVDFDYLGPAGAPLVFRTEVVAAPRSWDWPDWWPWRRARAKA